MTEIKIKIQIKHIIALSSANSPADLMNIKLTNKTHASRTNAKAHKTEIKDEELFDLAILAKIREVCKSMTYSSHSAVLGSCLEHRVVHEAYQPV